MKVSLKEYGDPVRIRVTNHIFWTQGLKSGDNSTLPASTQVRVESRLRLISYQEAGRQNNMPKTCDGDMEEEQDMLSPDTQSFTAAAIKLYSEAKKTFPAKYPHEARFVCTDDWGAGGVSVYAKTAIRIVHTHAHTNARRRAGCRHTGGEAAFHSALAVSLRLPHSKKFELFLNFSSKFESNCENLLLLYREEIRPASSPSSFHPFLSCPSSSS